MEIMKINGTSQLNREPEAKGTQGYAIYAMHTIFRRFRMAEETKKAKAEIRSKGWYL